MTSALARNFTILFVLLFSAASSPAVAAPSDSLSNLGSVVRRFEGLLQNGLTELAIPGAAVAIVKDGKTIYLKGFGIREVGRPEPVDVHTVFRLSSLSKAFASSLAGVLVQDGVLDWDDSVVSHLPSFALEDSNSTQNLTIRHLLSHTTGLPPHAYTNLVDDNVPYERIVDQLHKVKLHCEVGTCFAYQNVVYSLIGDIIEGTTGRSYSDMLKHSLLLPLEMYDASSTHRAFLSSRNHAAPHVRGGNKWLPVAVRKAYYTVAPAAGVNASISDMAQWLKAQMGAMKNVLSSQTLNELHEPFIRTSKRKRYYRRWRRLRKTYYGLGWRVFDYDGMKLVYHGGYVRGFRSEIAFDPQKRIGIVILMNSANPLIGRCVPTFFNLYLAWQNSESSP